MAHAVPQGIRYGKIPGLKSKQNYEGANKMNEQATWGATNPAQEPEGPTTKTNREQLGVVVQMNDELWTRKILAAFLGYSEETLRGYERQYPERVPPRIATLKRALWLKSEVLKWLAENTKRAHAPRQGPPVENAVAAGLTAPERVPRRGRPRNVLA